MPKRAKTLGAILLFALVLSCLPAASLGAPGQPEAHLERFGPLDHFDVPALPVAEIAGPPEPLTDGPAAGDDISRYPYSRFVFESARDNNWEIYIASKRGTQYETRLTNHPANDLLPRLTRGSARVIFTTDRDGNFELYSMRNDGGDLRRLTFNPGDDVYPAWSPDGARIAFQSYRDGQAEIYVMNADGSNLQRLTNNPDFDGQPYWSPDGQKIIFTSYRNGGYRIWVMQANGSGQYQLSTQPYSSDPSWSPDGNTIVFGADENYDGWIDVWKINSDGSGEENLGLMDDRITTDLIPRGWAPDSRELALTEVKYTLYEEEWYWLSATLQSVTLGTYPSFASMSPTSEEWNPDWQSTDLSVPASYPRALPEYTPAHVFQVDFVGFDPGPAMISSYDVQVMENNSGEWLDWGPTNQPYITYNGNLGETYAFRVRARDGAYNVEPWQSGEVAQTTLYQWALVGQLRDNRGHPVPAVQAASSPAALNEGQAGEPDGFLRRYMTSSPATFQFSKNGYGALPPLSLAYNSAHSSWWGLPPLDNQVSNGDFEAGSLAGWSATPEHSAEAFGAEALTGGYKAILGSLFNLATQTLLVNNEYTIGQPAIQRDSLGVVHAVWADSSAFPGDPTPGLGDLRYSYRQPSGDWSAPVVIDPTHTVSYYNPVLAAGPDGSLHLVWMIATDTGGVLNYASKASGGSWSATSQVAVTGWLPSEERSHLEVETDGRLHLVWHDMNGSFNSEKPAGGSWSPAEMLTGGTNYQAITLSPDQTLHRLYYDGPAGGVIKHTSRPAGGVWSAAQVIGVYANTKIIDLVATSDGGLHAVWGAGNLQYAYRPPAGDWQPDVHLATKDAYGGDVELDALGGEVLLVHIEKASDQALLRRADGSWSAAESLGLKCSYHALDFKTAGEADLICLTIAGSQDTLRYSPIYMVNETQLSLARTLSLPPSLHAPTLALGYRLVGANGAGLFEVRVDGASVLSESQASGEWTQFTLDLAPWAGQAVDLEFRLTRPDPAQPFSLELDDISAGSWLTPLIERVEPQTVQPGYGGQIMLHGQNFIDPPQVQVDGQPAGNVAWLNAETLSFTLPAGLGQGTYSLQVSNPAGQSALRINGLQVGGWISLPLIHRGR